MQELMTLAPLTVAQARAITDEVKGDARALWAKLLGLYEGGAHTALGYRSWADYCAAEFEMSDASAYRLLQAARVVAQLPIGSQPSNEAQARELARLPEPEVIREVWQEVKEERGDAVTAADVREAVDRRLGIERPAPMRAAPSFLATETEPLPLGYDEPIADAEGVEHVSYPLPVQVPEAEAATQAPAFEPSFVIPPRGLDPHSKAWHAAVAPAMYVRLDPDAVIATREPKEIERGLAMMADAVEYLNRLIAAGRAVVGRSRLEVIR